MSHYKIERENMVESQIRTNAVTDPALLKAFYTVPREIFVPPSQRGLAYMDAPLRVENAREGHAARYLLAPMVLAKLAQLAEIGPADKVLDVAPATGYSSAIFSRLAEKVVALECDPGLAALANDALTAQGAENVTVVTAPLAEGAPEYAPYNVIFINGRIDREPETLVAQLAENGRLVTVYGKDTTPKACIFRKIDTNIQSSAIFDLAAPLLSEFMAEPNFIF